MDILFENSHVRNREVAKEIYGYYYFRRRINIFAYLLLGLGFIANLLDLIVYGSCDVTIFILIPFVALLPVFCYISQVRAMVNRDKELCGKEIEVRLVVTESAMEYSASTGALCKVGLDRIRSAVQTKNLILLRSRSNILYIFRKDGFTVGRKEDFIAFLKGRGIKVRGK